MKILITVICLAWQLHLNAIELDKETCGQTYSKPIRFPWIGIMYYQNDKKAYSRLITCKVFLIHSDYVIGYSHDVSRIPPKILKDRTFVFLGPGPGPSAFNESLNANALRIESFIIHPEHNKNHLNSLALIKLLKPDSKLKPGNAISPICLRRITHVSLSGADIWNIETTDTYGETSAISMMPIPRKECDKFYEQNQLEYLPMKPTYYTCASEIHGMESCIKEAGSALIYLDQEGRLVLIGIGIRGPGCESPSRFIDVSKYIKWIENVDELFSLEVVRMAPNELYMQYRRSSISNDTLTGKMQPFRTPLYRENRTFGDCVNIPMSSPLEVYRDESSIKTVLLAPVRGSYILTIRDFAEYYCLHVNTIKATGAIYPYIWLTHYCPLETSTHICHKYAFSVLKIRINFIFAGSMTLQIRLIGNDSDAIRNTKLPTRASIKKD